MNQDINLQYVKRAKDLIACGSLQSLGDGQFQIDSFDLIEPIVIAINSCRCAEFIINQIRCEHIWAAIGATAAMLISEFENAESLTELSSLGASQKNIINSLPEPYASAVWQVTRSRSCQIAGAS